MTGRVYDMSEQDCWATLARLELGRLAYSLEGRVRIAPINYAVDGQRRLVFRTAEGSKLAGILDNPQVAFEVDEMTDEAAQSVVVEGRAVELTGEQAAMTDQLRLRPWVRTVKNHVIAIEVDEVSGRFFHLTKPWVHMLPH